MTARLSTYHTQRSARIAIMFRQIARLCDITVILIGVVVLVGWLLDISAFKQIVPGLATMKANTAICLTLSGFALIGISAGHARPIVRWSARTSAGVVLGIAALTLCEYVFGWNLRLDQLLFADPASAIFPGRMSIITALSFLLLGLAWMLFDVQAISWLTNTLIFIALFVTWMAIVGYIYGVTSLYQIFPFSTIAVHTAAALIILSIGTVFARPNQSLAALIANDSAAGLMARRLLPAAILIPTLLGWLRWQGQLAGLYDTEFGLVIMVVATTLVFTAFIWWNARSLALLDHERLHVAEALQDSEARFRAIFSQAAVGLARVGLDGRWLELNQKLSDIVGYTPAELLECTFQSITYHEDLDADLAYAQQLLCGEITTYSIEKRYVRKDSSLVWMNLTVSLVRAASGEPQYFIAVLQDITDQKRAEAAQKESAARLAGIVGSAMDAIVSIDEARNILLFNAAAEQMFGCSAAAVIGQSIDQFLPVYLRDRHATHLQTFGNTGVTSRSMTSLGTLIAVRADGEEFPIEATISQIVVAAHKIYTVIIRDITERKRAEQAIQRYIERLKHLRQIDQAMLTNRSLEEITQAALAHIWQMIPCTRASVVLVDMAAQAITLFAVQVNGELRMPPGLQAPIEIIGAAFEPLTHGQVYQVPDIAALPEPPAALRAAQVEHVRAYAYVPIMSDTELIGMLCLGSDQPGAFPDESIDIAMELAGQLAIAIEQERLRAQIQEHAEQLELRVATRTAELASANQELEAFSYSVSHDLRAPLRAIAGFSRILIDEYLSVLPAEAQDYLLLVRDNAQQMDQLINDLLAFARLSRQPLNTQVVAMTDLARQVIAELSHGQAERPVEFVVADMPSCSGDPALLRQVYINLLTNALKFTGKRSVARIEVGAQANADLPAETVYFVKDNGAGFDMRYAAKLFGVFQRLHRVEEYEGTGVGLAIVQRVVHRHGGRIWAEAAIDQGATFFFTLGGAGIDV